MKTYNSIVISHTARCIKQKDDEMCKSKGLTALDFIFWWNDALMSTSPNVRQSAFNLILNLCDLGEIEHPTIKKPFRLACIIYHKFVNVSESTIPKLREEENEFFKSHDKVTGSPFDFSKYYTYDRFQSNKKIFGFLKSKGISASLISELISRGFLGYDQQFNNLVFFGRTMGQEKSIEKHGITSKHFMRLEGIPYPFVFWADTGENYDPTSYRRVDVYPNTLSLLKAISEMKENDTLDYEVLYVSVHTLNYSFACLDNLLLDYPDRHCHFTFDDIKGYNKYLEEKNTTEETEDDDESDLPF